MIVPQKAGNAGRIAAGLTTETGNLARPKTLQASRKSATNLPLFPGYSELFSAGSGRNLAGKNQGCYASVTSPAFSWRPNRSRRRSAEAALPRWRHPISGSSSTLKIRVLHRAQPPSCEGISPKNPPLYPGYSALCRASARHESGLTNPAAASASHAASPILAGVELPPKYLAPAIAQSASLGCRRWGWLISGPSLSSYASVLCEKAHASGVERRMPFIIFPPNPSCISGLFQAIPTYLRAACPDLQHSRILIVRHHAL